MPVSHVATELSSAGRAQHRQLWASVGSACFIRIHLRSCAANAGLLMFPPATEKHNPAADERGSGTTWRLKPRCGNQFGSCRTFETTLPCQHGIMFGLG